MCDSYIIPLAILLPLLIALVWVKLVESDAYSVATSIINLPRENTNESN